MNRRNRERARSLYLAAGLFNVAERRHNARLDRLLTGRGWDVRLPQRQALAFLHEGKLDLDALAEACRKEASDEGNICVVCLDGADADSGAATEYMAAIMGTGRVITYRTDFRTAPEQELGVNAMFRQKGTDYFYLPCYAVEEEEFDTFYDQLADEIDAHALKWGRILA